MIRAAVIALALLATPAAADTIFIDYNIYVEALAELQTNLTRDGYYGAVPGCSFECTIQKPLLWSFDYVTFYETTGFLPGATNFVIVGVPEPAVWGMMLCGFAFLAFFRMWKRA